MKTEMEFKDRLKSLIDRHAGGNVSEFGRMLGMERAQRIVDVLQKGAQPRLDFLELIAANIPGVSMDWLIAGKESISDNSVQPVSMGYDRVIEEQAARIEDQKERIREKTDEIMFLREVLRSRLLMTPVQAPAAAVGFSKGVYKGPKHLAIHYNRFRDSDLAEVVA